jgi:hypothetical protein
MNFPNFRKFFILVGVEEEEEGEEQIGTQTQRQEQHQKHVGKMVVISK